MLHAATLAAKLVSQRRFNLSMTVSAKITSSGFWKYDANSFLYHFENTKFPPLLQILFCPVTSQT